MTASLVRYDGDLESLLTLPAATIVGPPAEQLTVEQPGLMRRIFQSLQNDRTEGAELVYGKLPTETQTLKRILVMIPAHNEAQSIRDCLEGVADQLVDFDDIEINVIVVADNCTDNTEKFAMEAAIEFDLKLAIFKTSGNKQRKVGALNAVWAHLYGNVLDAELHDVQPTSGQLAYRKSIKAILGMDADSRLAPEALKAMWNELMSSPDIGGVMARYTMRFPLSKRSIARDDPRYDQKLASGNYGGPINRWWVSMQKQDMASWLLSLFHRGGSTYVLGGQASLFRPVALASLVNEFKTLGPWDPSTQVEDMKLTWRLQETNWKTLVSKEARCYVDAMRSYHTLVTQREKWDGGLVGLLTDKNGQAKSRHTGFLWRQQAKMAMDAVTRLLFFTLMVIALATNQYEWNWIWLTPPVVASLLNMRLALRVPQHRPIDVFLAATLVSPEIYLLVRLIVWAKVWSRRLSTQDGDGWEKQYAAQRGDTRSKLHYGLTAIALLAGSMVWASIHFRSWLTSPHVQQSCRFNLMVGFFILSGFAVIQTAAMLRQHWLLRSHHRP